MEPPHRRGAGSDQGPQPQPRGQPWPACSAPDEGRGSADSGELRPGLRGAAARAAQDPRANIQRKRRKLSKLERRINAVIIFQEEALSNIAVHQIMLPSADYQNGILNHLGHSAFFPNIINTQESSSNTFLLSSHTDFTSASVSEYKSYDEVRLISVERRNSATTNNSVIVHYQIPTQEEMTGKVQSEVKGGKLKVMGIIQEESHNCSKDFQAVSTSTSTAKDPSFSRAC
ncbi:activating transcription factor 7-interacting protein 2 isoform X4 [Cygnus olor]|uniref:activating transcription factor 7-interacting protein 2 isoform X4 n=1 Tax=Cygnus olor TaxID=8869 RepID=UPI001ADE235C|nr:activating transcription factor 7-interacting protein 2 isoform X4 [Cygnus olor]